jgi:PAS domain S-box-containing protein
MAQLELIDIQSLPWRAAISRAAYPVTIVDARADDMPIVYVNRAFEEVTGYSAVEVVGRNCRLLQGADRAQAGVDAIRAALAGGVPVRTRLRNYRRDGTVFWNEVFISPLRDASGEITHFLGIQEDVTARIAVETAQRDAEHRLRDLLELSSDWMWEQDAELRFTRLWTAPGGETPFSVDDLIGRRRWEIAFEGIDEHGWAAHRHALEAREPFRDFVVRRNFRDGTTRWISTSGVPIFDADGAFRGYRGIGRDVTEQRRSEDLLYTLANYDAATGLPNQNFVRTEIGRLASARDVPFAVFRIELTRLNVIADTFDAATADAALGACVAHLRDTLAPEAVVGRVSTHGLAVVAAVAPQSADALAAALAAAAARPVNVSGIVIDPWPSLGYALHPEDGADAAGLLRAAHAALAEARTRVGTRPRRYDEALGRELAVRRRLSSDLHHALAAQALTLEYEPVIDLRTGRTLRLDAQVCWLHPALGRVARADIARAADAGATTVALGEWMLRAACRQLRTWHDGGLMQLGIAVQLSARQFRQEGLLASVQAALREAGIAPHHLQIGIAEGVLAEDSGQAREVLRRLRAIGVRVSLDGFGRLASSLTAFQRFPLDVVHIDEAFVAALTADGDSNAMTRAILGMAESVGIESVARGVAREGQLAELRRHGCRAAQGPWLSPPLAADAVSAWLARPATALPEPSESVRTLLLVDDEPNVLAALKRLLRREGYRIHATTSVAEAFEILAREPVGVVVSDQRMPELSGTEFLRRVKALHPRTVRIMLSGYTELASVIGAINEGSIYKFFAKPWDDDVLRSAIDAAFRRLAADTESEDLRAELAAANRALEAMNADLESRVAERSARVDREQRQLARAHATLAQLPVAVIGVDEDHHVVAANDSAVHVFGPLLGADARHALPQPLAALLERACAARTGRTRLVFADHRWTASCTLACDADGIAYGRLLVLARECGE